MVKILCNTKEFDELLFDVLYQACGNQTFKGNKPIGKAKIDNQCLSAYEDACDYLTENGYLKTKDGRIYTINKQDEVKPNSFPK